MHFGAAILLQKYKLLSITANFKFQDYPLFKNFIEVKMWKKSRGDPSWQWDQKQVQWASQPSDFKFISVNDFDRNGFINEVFNLEIGWLGIYIFVKGTA